MSRFCDKCLYFGTKMCKVENCSKGVKTWKFLKMVGDLLLLITLLLFSTLFLIVLNLFGDI